MSHQALAGIRSAVIAALCVVAVAVPTSVGAQRPSKAPDATTASTDPPATDPPATDPPATDPPATDPPATDPPATDPPATDPPATDPPVTTGTNTNPSGPSGATGISGASGSTGTTAPQATAQPTVTVKTAIPVEQATQLDKAITELVDPGTVQPVWDATAARVALTAKIEEVRARYSAAQANLSNSQLVLLATQTELNSLRQQQGELDGQTEQKVKAAAALRRKMLDRLVQAYIRGNQTDIRLLASASSPESFNRGSRFLTTVAAGDRRSAAQYKAAVKDLDTDLLALANKIGRQISVVERSKNDVSAAEQLLASTKLEWDAYAAGSSVFVDGFVFPVAAPVDFIDSWGFPRMTGTGYAHWHQGTDVMGQMGAPLIATENGYIEKLGQASLGGNKLWVAGDSGTKYYYAHLSAFVPGMSDGQRVCAGQVVGYLGDSGNAQGTPPHVHFEIHPGGGNAVNPYPILAMTYASQKDLLQFGPYVSPTASCPPQNAATDAAVDGQIPPGVTEGASGASSASGASGPSGASGSAAPITFVPAPTTNTTTPRVRR